MKRPDITPPPEIEERLPFDENKPEEYLESDRDWLDHNPEIVEWLIEHKKQVAALPALLSALERVLPDCLDALENIHNLVEAEGWSKKELCIIVRRYAKDALTLAGYQFDT